MSVYPLVLFLHIIAALGLFAAIGLEWAGLVNLRRAATAGQAREWARLLGALRAVGMPSVLLILASGIYMMATRWGGQAWIGAAFGGIVLMAVLGGAVTGRRVGPLVRAARKEEGPVSGELAARLRDPFLLGSLCLRTAIGLGIVFLMTLKPAASGALATMAAALVLGLAAGFLTRSRGRRPLAMAPHASES